MQVDPYVFEWHSFCIFICTSQWILFQEISRIGITAIYYIYASIPSHSTFHPVSYTYPVQCQIQYSIGINLVHCTCESYMSLAFMPTVNLEWLINLTHVCFWTAEGRPEYPEKDHAVIGRTGKPPKRLAWICIFQFFTRYNCTN